MAPARKAKAAAPTGAFDWVMNERTGYYDVRRGKTPIGLRFADRKKVESYVRGQNARAEMAARSAAWPKRPPSHVQTRLMNPPARAKGATVKGNPSVAELRGELVEAIKARTRARLGLSRRAPPAGPVELVRELRAFDARVEAAMDRLNRAARRHPVETEALAETAGTLATVALNPGKGGKAKRSNPGLSGQLRAAMQDVSWAQQAHRKKPTAASQRKLDAAKEKFERLAAREKNPDFFRDRFGRPHPIRGSPGYEDAFPGMSRADKKYLRSGSDQPRGGYTQMAGGRAGRVEAAAKARLKPRKGQREAGSVGEHRFAPRKKPSGIGRRASFY